MPAYNFHAQFAEAVEQRIKRQTIRAERKDGKKPKVGDFFAAYTGMRTKKCRKLYNSFIHEVMPFEITAAEGMRLNGQKLDAAEQNSIALLDGFNSGNEMVAWFIKTHGLPFRGHLIRWL